jgi:glycosidase
MRYLTATLGLSLVLLFPTACSAGSSVSLPINASLKEAPYFWIALDAGPGPGSTVIRTDSGKRIFLPFQADLLIRFKKGEVDQVQQYSDYQWQETPAQDWQINWKDGEIEIPRDRSSIRAYQWVSENGDGLLGENQPAAARGPEGDIYLPHYSNGDGQKRTRYGVPGFRPRIYQLLPRLFGNANDSRIVNGTLEQNGSGKFADLSFDVLQQLSRDGFSHLWLTGVLQQATSTDYSDIGQPADDPDLLKGIAGSPYAIRDYFDVCPDYAQHPEKRLEEFKALIERMHAAELKVVIDFVPNHVARSYHSDIRPDLSFGENDNPEKFFDPHNNFFYLRGDGPLRLPTVDPESGQILSDTAKFVGGADGLFEPEKIHGRVTGNNVVSWQPSQGDWYETVKLNYGYHFLEPETPPAYPCAANPDALPPDTWKKMDEIIAYWQEMGVDGFRADMAHMVPPEFWKWLIHRSRERNADVFWMAEAYNDDPAKVPGHDPALSAEDNIMLWLLDAGFDAVYDDPSYDTLHDLYTKGKWANDLEREIAQLGPYFFDCAVRYAENHDEVRLAHPDNWGNKGMEVGRPVTTALFGLSRGPVMIYHGQMVGEPGLGKEGFGGDDQRTTIFDYWSLPELSKWWNGGAADGALLSPEQKELRQFYTRLLHSLNDPALGEGTFFPLNLFNESNDQFGRIEDTSHSGHWFLAYARVHPLTGEAVLVTANFHPSQSTGPLRILLPDKVQQHLHLKNREGELHLYDLGDPEPETRSFSTAKILNEGVSLESLPPLSSRIWKLKLNPQP